MIYNLTTAERARAALARSTRIPFFDENRWSADRGRVRDIVKTTRLFNFFFIIIVFRFRQGFKQFFSFVPCINVRTGSLIRREVVTSRYSYSGSPDAHYRIVRNGNRKPGKRDDVIACASAPYILHGSGSVRGRVSVGPSSWNPRNASRTLSTRSNGIFIYFISFFFQCLPNATKRRRGKDGGRTFDRWEGGGQKNPAAVGMYGIIVNTTDTRRVLFFSPSVLQTHIPFPANSNFTEYAFV